MSLIFAQIRPRRVNRNSLPRGPSQTIKSPVRIKRVAAGAFNSDDEMANRGMRISDFERIRAELDIIRAMVAAYTKARRKIRKLWHRGHELILTRPSMRSLPSLR